MASVLENIEYGITIELPEGFDKTEEFWELFPMQNDHFEEGGVFTHWSFELESDAVNAIERIEEMIIEQGLEEND